MLARIRTFFAAILEEEVDIENDTDTKQLAAAALMIEIATVDDHFDSTEIQALVRILQQQFSLTSEALYKLIDVARSKSDEATSLYQFTRLVNDSFTQEEKFELVEGMWKVAFADGNLDKYEEHMIRRIADLIHISHSDFIRTKKLAQQTS